MSWVYLLIAAACEVGWAIGMKFARDFSRFWPSVWTILLMVLSVVFLSKAVRTLPIGTAYAIWTGLGAAGTALLGMILLGEERSPARFLCLAVIIAGVTGLKLTSRQERHAVPAEEMNGSAAVHSRTRALP
jgi:quaternary ammonium compound-resistance protein SugE